MRMIHKILMIAFLILGKTSIYSQTQIPLYKMVMNSDAILIVEINDFKRVEEQKSEFYSEYSIKFEGTLNVLKNTYNVKFKNLKVKNETNNNDFYRNINGEYCMGVAIPVERGKRYYNIFFLKKRGKEYFVMAHLWNNIFTEDLPFFERNIIEIDLISKEKRLGEKKKKIEKWFENSNIDHPKEYSIESPFTEEFNAFFEKHGY